ncbi:heterokaryon incompatibility protein-domain-containing protein [Sordaria brevicollis]|uniref:Heterokaryon incompatibility protein-domain-containing protein n=1 Tax=Sordaria brevicollis TaxID=83679 RepID=A0AAE0NVH1_SORBR|nr:heterokaryon incompatibility protein-domain-containing protein [Sordaria brevicollis]
MDDNSPSPPRHRAPTVTPAAAAAAATLATPQQTTQQHHHHHPELSYDTIPLNTPATEIRLLQLIPSGSDDFSSPLHCRLYTTPISSPAAPFKALSYAWGSDERPNLIYVDSDTSHTTRHKDDTNSVDDVSFSNGDDADGQDNIPAVQTAPMQIKKRCIIRITSSLDSCLRHLRAIYHRDNPSTEMTVWIDQLCIAQLDPREKAVQVGLMAQVYSRAEQVLIWLGSEADGSDVVMDALAELLREYESFGEEAEETLAGFLASLGIADGKIAGKGTTGTTICGGDDVVDTAGSNGPIADDGNGAGVGINLGVDYAEVVEAPTPILDPGKVSASTGRTVMEFIENGAETLVHLWASGELQSFFRRSWFTRVWVVQEACLCEETAFVCGTRSPVDYDVLVLICMCITHAIQEFERKGGYTPEWDGGSPLSTDAEIAGVRMPRDTARGLGRLMHQLTQSFSGRHSRLEQANEEKKGDNLFTLLVDMYANVYLCREAKLHRDRIYALLGVAADADELGINLDYSSQTSTAQILTGVVKAIVIDMVPTSTIPEILGLRGYLVDAVEEVGCMSYAEYFPTTERWAESIVFFESLDKLWELLKKKNEVIYDTPERREEGVWRVPVGDMVYDLEYGLGFDITAPEWRKSVDENAKERAKEWAAFALGLDGGKAYDRACVEMVKRRLYLTEKGYMGMGPIATEPGDVVVVFPGARVPFVLRPIAEKDTFTYEGDVYCDGIMDGEITRREEKRDFFLV